MSKNSLAAILVLVLVVCCVLTACFCGFIYAVVLTSNSTYTVTGPDLPQDYREPNTTTTKRETIVLDGTEIYDASYDVSMILPDNAVAQISTETSGALEGTDLIAVRGKEFDLYVRFSWEVEIPYTYPESKLTGFSEQFGTVYRFLIEDDYYAYTNDYDALNCQNPISEAKVKGPCGYGQITIPERSFFVECVTDKPRELMKCDEIVKTLQISER